MHTYILHFDFFILDFPLPEKNDQIMNWEKLCHGMIALRG